MMTRMNDQIREAVRIELARRDMTRAELAKELGVTPQYVSRVISGATGKMPDIWQGILDKLDLEISATRRKDT